eukprot:1601880-Pleurochrysis_carterae.AAC.2
MRGPRYCEHVRPCASAQERRATEGPILNDGDSEVRIYNDWGIKSQYINVELIESRFSKHLVRKTCSFTISITYESGT